MTKYIMGKEIEVDAICDGTDIPDSRYYAAYRGAPVSTPATVSPCIRPRTSPSTISDTIVDYTEKLARALHVKGHD